MVLASTRFENEGKKGGSSRSSMGQSYRDGKIMFFGEKSKNMNVD